MTLNIYSDLQGVLTINNIVNNWKNVTRPQKNKAILELIINMTGFTYEIRLEEINAPDDAKKYLDIIKNMTESDFVVSKRFFSHPEKNKIIKRFDLFVEMLVKTFDSTTFIDWLHTFTKFTEELIKNKSKMSDLVVVATFARLIFVKHFASLRARCDKEREYMSTHEATMKVLTESCKVLFESFAIGLPFKDLHEMYVNIGLSLFKSYPDFFIIDWNRLELFEALLSTNHMKTISQAYDTLQALMEGEGIEDEEIQEDIRLEISEFFETYLDPLFIEMILHERVTVSKQAFQLLILVQKYRGSNSVIKDKDSLEGVYESFMRDSKVIRGLAMEFMKITMKQDELLTFILNCLEKYEVATVDIVNSIFDREIFAQWELYGIFLDKPRHVNRSLTIVTDIIKQVLVRATIEYQKDEQVEHTSEVLHDAKIDILEFLRILPNFLVVYRVTTPNTVRYTKMLQMLNSVNFENIAQDVTHNCLEMLMKELISALQTFYMCSVIEAVTSTLLKLADHFDAITDGLLNLLMQYSQIFASTEKITTPEEAVIFKRATYFVYTCLSKKPNLMPNESYITFLTNSFDQMVNDEHLEEVPVEGAVLAVWTQVLAKCYKLVVNKIDEELDLNTVETAMNRVLAQMRSMMMRATDLRITILFSDMKLVLANAANIMHYLSFRSQEDDVFSSTFTCIVKLTEKMIVNDKFPEILPLFAIFYDVHYQIIQNHEEISWILQYFGQPSLQKHFQMMMRLLTIAYTRDNSEDKKRFRNTIVQTIICVANEANISLFWLAFRQFSESMKFKPKDFFTFIANMSFEILQHQLLLERNPDSNRFQILKMLTEIVDDMRKSTAVQTSVMEVFGEIQHKHEKDFTDDENQFIKGFLKELCSNKRRRETQVA